MVLLLVCLPAFKCTALVIVKLISLPDTMVIIIFNNHRIQICNYSIFCYSGLYDASNGSAADISPPDLDGCDAADGGIVLNKDPVMLLNEFCQRSQQKVHYKLFL